MWGAGWGLGGGGGPWWGGWGAGGGRWAQAGDAVLEGVQEAVPAKTAEGAGRPATVSFAFDRVGVAVPHYILTVREDGTGRYEADEAGAAGQAGRHIDRPIPVSGATVTKVFEQARAENHFDVACASKLKNIADTGRKVLTYTGPDGSGSCLYNYSERKDVRSLTDLFQAMAFTLDEGRKLEFAKRFDRLGLDAEMNGLVKAAEANQAAELGTISAILTQIAHDGELMERVRLRAAKLLEMGQKTP